ncbi:VIT1/CCC1 transporter family protein [Candidatus Woesearchaeota archaeon]|nr:VIT1/CCC1 transporter family protein [Candidatus Woesearchaeota archaeon]
MTLSSKMLEQLKQAQRNEITEHLVYQRLAELEKDPKNKKVLIAISKDERSHYFFWKKHTGVTMEPNMLKVHYYYWVSRIFGITFGIKLMEKGEDTAQGVYAEVAKVIPAAQKIVLDEHKHEQKLIEMLDEERLKYVGSVVLGLNDALVELSGALAGFTFALQNGGLIGIVGLITGVAASLSMAASEYLSQKSDANGLNPIKASIYTGSAYIATVIALIVPYFVFTNVFVSLGFTLVNVLLIIALFNYYISVAQDVSFKSRFLEMAGLSMGVAFISFLFGIAVKTFFGFDL